MTKSATFNKIMAHFNRIGFDCIDLFKDLTYDLFAKYLTFADVLKLFIMFLNEGIKIYFRITYALLFTLKKEILMVIHFDINIYLK